MTGQPRALYIRRDAYGVPYAIWQTPQEAWHSDMAEGGALAALRSWYEYREMVATWVYYAAHGGTMLDIDSPEHEGELN